MTHRSPGALGLADELGCELVRGIGRLVTASGPPINDAAVVIDRGRVGWVGPFAALPAQIARRIDRESDVSGALVTPGLIDAHSHPVYVAPRLQEVARRANGASYLEIAEQGGGIAATIRSTRAIALDDLERVVATRLRVWLDSGTTTAEVKTGYHLDRDGELGAVRLLAGLARRGDLPSLAITFLAAHGVPPGDGLSQQEYAREAASWSRAAATAGATACDVFCDVGYFSVEEARAIVGAGRDAGLAIRLHADELARTGVAQLAAEVGAQSADHLLWCTDEDAMAMARAGVVATLCPVTAMSIGRRPPVESFRKHGVQIALGTDHNPGTSGVTSMSLAISLAVAGLGLSLDEAVLAATRGGAESLGLADRGAVNVGLRS